MTFRVTPPVVGELSELQLSALLTHLALAHSGRSAAGPEPDPRPGDGWRLLGHVLHHNAEEAPRRYE